MWWKNMKSKIYYIEILKIWLIFIWIEILFFAWRDVPTWGDFIHVVKNCEAKYIHLSTWCFRNLSLDSIEILRWTIDVFEWNELSILGRNVVVCSPFSIQDSALSLSSSHTSVLSTDNPQRVWESFLSPTYTRNAHSEIVYRRGGITSESLENENFYIFFS